MTALPRVEITDNLKKNERYLESKDRNKEQRRQEVYLSDFSMDRRCSTQGNGILHKILNAGILDLLLDLPCRFLPCSEVNLCNMSGHRPEERHLVVNNPQRILTRVHESEAGVILAIKLQLVFDDAMNDPDEVDVPAEQEDQEPLSL